MMKRNSNKMLPNKASTSKHIFFLKRSLQLFVGFNIFNKEYYIIGIRTIVESRFAFDELYYFEIYCHFFQANY